MNRIRVLQLIDSLNVGGAERVAVNIANRLPTEQFESHLGVTRTDGPLRAEIASHIRFVLFERRQRFDLCALVRLVRYAREHKIAIIHAHSTSLFAAVAASLFLPNSRIIWHDHFGLIDEARRNPVPYRIAGRRLRAVVAVNERLANWARTEMHIAANRTFYLPNFSVLPQANTSLSIKTHSESSHHIVCVANLRPQKDHVTLVRAMALVIADVPDAHLWLVGATTDSSTVNAVRNEIARLGLETTITIMGTRTDIAIILRSSSIGVLSSKSEGFPLALIEYGTIGLAVVATNVGQCSEILARGEAGILVPPENPNKLAAALTKLLLSAEERSKYSRKFHQRVHELYDADLIVKKLIAIYDSVLDDDSL